MVAVHECLHVCLICCVLQFCHQPRKYTPTFGAWMVEVFRAHRAFDLPNPRQQVDVPATLTDFELFRTYCLNEDMTLKGDLWHDAPWINNENMLLEFVYVFHLCLIDKLLGTDRPSD